MGEFYDRRIHSEDNLQKLQESGHLTPETVEKIKSNSAAFLDQATGAASAAAKTNSVEEKRAEYALGQQALQEKINADMNAEPGWFTSRLTPEQAKAKYYKDAEHLATMKAELDDEDAKLNPPAAPVMSPDGQAVAQPTALGGMPQQPTVPLTPLGPQAGQEQGVQSLDQAIQPYTRGIDVAQQGLAMQMSAADAKAKEESALLGQMAKDMQKNQAALDATRQAKAKWVEDNTKQIDDEQRAVSELRVDPDRYWNNMSTLQKIMGSLAVATGRASGDKNAGNVIANAIERDIEAQKIAIGQKQKGVDGRINSYERFKDKFKDDEMAQLASMDTGLKVAQLKIQQIAAKTGSMDTQGKLMGVMGELEQKRAAIRMQIGEKLAGMYGGGDLNPEAMDKDKRERWVPGFGPAYSKEDATTMKVAIGKAKMAKDTINEILQIAEMGSMQKLSPELAGRAQILATQVKAAIRDDVVGPGTLSETDKALLDATAADPSKIFALGAALKGKYKAISEGVDRGLAAKAYGFGLKTPAERVGFTSAKK